MTCENLLLSDNHGSGRSRKLFAIGRVCLQQRPDPVEVRRGMPIVAYGGAVLGVVAAVVIDSRSQEATHVLLCHVPPTADHRLIPLSLIDAIDEEMVHLQAAHAEIAQLPVYRPDG